MAVEIERKFLVKGDFISFSVKNERIRQAYISSDPKRSVRIRQKGEKAYLTIKGESSDDGTTRIEWEKEISIADADILFGLCKGGVIDKVRYYVPTGELMFEVDIFEGDNKGLIVAEIELKNKDDFFVQPDWLGMEVTGDKRYYNSQLTKNPYKKW
ncbi:CYTH domain-containing protein [Dysgonomonas sp. 216]|uniref:CYTH domain-containing protein n=1 Tax=Dysgonomonas sp. 216 TaxID=2302934 RepID=UPI0013D28190|nr:CYTH domain-containing protein [Dysgonomonas sp. 216]NDW18530.1 CYTH domain-containing protein [Dysgonomonas sp. 216]